MRQDKADLRTEAIAGVTTFFTMAYIVVVNPSILSTAGTGMAFGGTLTATVAVCFLMTLLMGLYARLPFAVAPGMGINGPKVFLAGLSGRDRPSHVEPKSAMGPGSGARTPRTAA